MTSDFGVASQADKHGYIERCAAEWPDQSTPSGLTRCALDAGHLGMHWHENVNRIIKWWESPQINGHFRETA